MVDRRVYEAVDRTFRDIRETDKPFGGITVVFAGDWQQILPVVRKGGRPEIVEACIENSRLWHNVHVMKLSTNMRVQLTGGDYSKFADHLLEIGEGRVPVVTDLGMYKIKLNDEFVFNGDTLLKLCEHVFKDLANNYRDTKWLCSRTILCPTNEDVEEVNNILIKKFHGQLRIHRSTDRIVHDDQAHHYPTEYLNTICVSGMPPHKLLLKVGCTIMLLRNFDPTNGHCNGTRYVVTSLHNHVIKAAIPRIRIAPSDSICSFQMEQDDDFLNFGIVRFSRSFTFFTFSIGFI